MHYLKSIAGLTSMALLASACASPPMGPTVGSMPPPGKPFEVFQQDKAVCEQYAQAQVGGQAQAANNQAVGGAVLGTVLGAGLGAAVGGGRGAAIGAASGAVVGTGMGAGGSQRAQYGIQGQYNNAYLECMYSKGNQVPGGYGPPPSYGPPPGYGSPQSYGPPQSGSYPPPPPPPAGYPPGPPPGY